MLSYQIRFHSFWKEDEIYQIMKQNTLMVLSENASINEANINVYINEMKITKMHTQLNTSVALLNKLMIAHNQWKFGRMYIFGSSNI